MCFEIEKSKKDVFGFKMRFWEVWTDVKEPPRFWEVL